MERQHLCRVTGRRGEARSAAFERRDPLFQYRSRRVADPGVDVAERLQAK
jgi:hypothetical protein